MDIVLRVQYDLLGGRSNHSSVLPLFEDILWAAVPGDVSLTNFDLPFL